MKEREELIEVLMQYQKECTIYLIGKFQEAYKAMESFAKSTTLQPRGLPEEKIERTQTESGRWCVIIKETQSPMNPKDKILLIVMDGERDIFHFRCCYKPEEAKTIIDRTTFTPGELLQLGECIDKAIQLIKVWERKMLEIKVRKIEEEKEAYEEIKHFVGFQTLKSV